MSSILSPNIHRNSMFPPRCRAPPCRKVDVTKVISGLLGHSTSTGPRPKFMLRESAPMTHWGTAPRS